jgi:sec-independent protein translocase protein TatB
MFDLSWSELLVIGVVALIAIGPKELPGALRALGHWTGKMRRMASDFQDQFRDAMREAEVADLKKQVDEMTDTTKSYANFDPLGDIQKDIEKLASDGSAVNPTSSAAIPPPPDVPATPAPGAPTPQAEGLPPATAAAVPIAPNPAMSAPDSARAPEPKAGQGA